MSDNELTIHLTDRELDVLQQLARDLDLPCERVMIQALRQYQKAMRPVDDITMVGGA